MRNVADTGLNILFQLLQNVNGQPEAAQSFYQTYYTDILQHMFRYVKDFRNYQLYGRGIIFDQNLSLEV